MSIYTHEHKIRVRYADTDKMGYVYYANYPVYFEEARTEMIRSLGITYKEMEDEGILLPVTSLTVEYKRPAYYDDLLTIITTITEKPSIMLKISYEVFNEDKTLICMGTTNLMFINKETRKLRHAPDYFLKKLEKK